MYNSDVSKSIGKPKEQNQQNTCRETLVVAILNDWCLWSGRGVSFPLGMATVFVGIKQHFIRIKRQVYRA